VPGVSGPSQSPQAGGGVGDICRKLWSSLEHADAAPATAEGTAARTAASPDAGGASGRRRVRG